MKLDHLKRRCVINVYNGNFVGYIIDVIVSLPEGNIISLIVKQSFIKRIFNFMTMNGKTIVNWENVVSIGKDVILVNIIDK